MRLGWVSRRAISFFYRVSLLTVQWVLGDKRLVGGFNLFSFAIDVTF